MFTIIVRKHRTAINRKKRMDEKYRGTGIFVGTECNSKWRSRSRSRLVMLILSHPNESVDCCIDRIEAFEQHQASERTSDARRFRTKGWSFKMGAVEIIHHRAGRRSSLLFAATIIATTITITTTPHSSTLHCNLLQFMYSPRQHELIREYFWNRWHCDGILYNTFEHSVRWFEFLVVPIPIDNRAVASSSSDVMWCIEK